MLKPLSHRLKKLKHDKRGNILLLAGAGFSVLVGAAGVGVDAVQWYLWNRQLQQAADSGALAGAHALHKGEEYSLTARTELERTANTAFNVERLTNPPASGNYAGDTGAVELIATTSRALPFSSLFLIDPPTIRVRAVAATISEGRHCVYALAEDGVGISVQGTAEADLGCGVLSNSRGKDSIYLHGSSYLTATPISAAGGIFAEDGTYPADASLQPFGIAKDDPLADRGLTVPSHGPCVNNFRLRPSESATVGSSNPTDVHCFRGGMDIKGTLTMRPGVYIMDGGSFKSNSQASITGRGVTIILTGSEPGNVATVDLAGGNFTDLSAPTMDQNPDWAGILFYQDQLGSNQRSKITGGTTLKMNGIVYLPGGDLDFAGNSGQDSDCLLLIAKRVGFAGDSKLKNECGDMLDDYDLSTRIIRVVE